MSIIRFSDYLIAVICKGSIMKRIFLIFICCSLLFVIFAFSADGAPVTEGSGVVRVGLFYGSGAKINANALCEAGYRVGYFEGEIFNTVFSFENRFVTFVKDTGVSISGNSVTAGDEIGAYHLESTAGFSSEAEAKRAAAAIKAENPSYNVFPAYIGGVYKIRIGSYPTKAAATADIGRVNKETSGELSAVGASKTAITMIDMNDKYIVCEIDLSAAFPAAMPKTESATMKNGNYYYEGAFEFKRFDGGDINLVNVVTIDQYICGVLPNEMSYDWPLEALKAQALCSRGYYIMHTTKHSKYGFGVCTTTDCQVYRGTYDQKARILEAVEGTKNLLVTYEGKPVETLFMASSGGYTESVENVWGGKALPYLIAQPDPETKPFEYSATVTNKELTEYFQGKGYKIGNVVDFYVSQYTVPAHNVYAITIVDDTGNKLEIKKCDNVRIALNKYVKSPRFTITPGGEKQLYISGVNEPIKGGQSVAVISASGMVENIPVDEVKIIDGSGNIAPVPGGENNGVYYINGTGWGHNVGMSQYGASAMAKRGVLFDEILRFYFPGCELATFPELGKGYIIS